MDLYKEAIAEIRGVEFQLTPRISFRFSKDITVVGIRQVLDLLRRNSQAFYLHDFLYPASSEDGSGAYMSYSQEQNSSGSNWSMTLGNHGWSGGIYHISDTTILAQLQSLIRLGLLKEIWIDNVVFRSHYSVKTAAESQQMDNRILEVHS